MEKTKIYFDDQQVHFLEVDYEWYEHQNKDDDFDPWPEILGVSLDGTMSIKIAEIPKDLKKQIIAHLYEQC